MRAAIDEAVAAKAPSRMDDIAERRRRDKRRRVSELWRSRDHSQDSFVDDGERQCEPGAGDPVA